jgi:hypothetical protein
MKYRHVALFHKNVVMKNLITLLALFISVSGKAQITGSVFSPILETYYAAKNALVAGDASGAAKHAASFNAAVSALDNKSMSADESNYFKSVQPALLTESKAIASSKDLAKQREAFSKLSQTMIILAKSVKLDTKPVYVDYCPMKKASWLSAEPAIKNPYYGSAMLTCGKITDTLK